MQVAHRLSRFGTSVFAEMTKVANETNAINLSQGFPDFDGPKFAIEKAAEAMRAGKNQYAPSRGTDVLRQAIARHQKHFYGLDVDPATGVVVTAGATEGIAAALLGVLNPGDEVLLFEPFYDSYPAVAALAGATCRYVTLRFPDFTLDEGDVKRAITDKTRVIVLNSPHNPTGKVFSRKELEFIATVAKEHNLLVLADEVYEHITFDGVAHIPISTLPDMWDRTITLSSGGKTFSFTGWKVGWATGPAALIDAVYAAHQFLTYAVVTPLQVATAALLDDSITSDYLKTFRSAYADRRSALHLALVDAGFSVSPPAGTYFMLADFRALSQLDDRAYALALARDVGVCAIPPSAFYESDKTAGRSLLRFAFCKRLSTIEAARKRLSDARNR